MLSNLLYLFAFSAISNSVNPIFSTLYFVDIIPCYVEAFKKLNTYEIIM